MVCINASLQPVCPASPVSKHHPFLLQPVMKIICLVGAETQHETSTSNKSCCQQWGLQDLSRSGKMKPYLYRPATQAIKVERVPVPLEKKKTIQPGWDEFTSALSRLSGGLDKRSYDMKFLHSRISRKRHQFLNGRQCTKRPLNSPLWELD